MQRYFLLMALLGAVSATSHMIMEQLSDVPEGWHSNSVPDASRPLHLRIAMTQPKEALFEQTLLDISTPGHARYGEHLKREELKDMLRPSSEATEAVLSWLEGSGITQIEENGEWVNFVATVATAEELLDTRFAIYRHEAQNVGKS